MKILLDCDGILADFTGATLDMLKRIGIGEYTVDQVTQYSILAALGLSKEQGMRARFEWQRAGFCSTIEPYADAQEYIDVLKGVGEVVVVTAPLDGARQWAWERKLWLKHYFGLTSVVSTSEKHHIVGDVLVDDLPSHLVQSPCRSKVLFQRPWNAAEEQASGLLDYFRVSTWDALVATTKAIASRRKAAA